MDGTSDTKNYNTKTLHHQQSSGVHRRRTLYLVRHGEAVHNVLEAKAQQEAKAKAQALNLSPSETEALMEEARQAVLQDASLRDAPLTERGKQQARECAEKLVQLIEQGTTHPPTEAMVSPLTRTLQTCQIILDTMKDHSQLSLRAHIRPEIQERQTHFPPDTPRAPDHLLRYTRENDRFVMTHVHQVSQEDVTQELRIRESKEMLRERASKLFDVLVENMEHRHVLIVSHKGYLRELERGLLGLGDDSPHFDNAEMRVYRIVFTHGERSLESIERVV